MKDVVLAHIVIHVKKNKILQKREKSYFLFFLDKIVTYYIMNIAVKKERGRDVKECNKTFCNNYKA